MKRPLHGFVTIIVALLILSACNSPGGSGFELSVKYDPNGATTGTVPIDTKEYSFNDQYTVLDNTGGLSIPGYHFMGWAYNNDSTLGYKLLPGQTDFVADDGRILYAKWCPDSDIVLSGDMEFISYGTALKLWAIYGAETNIIIPDYVNGKPVQYIEERIFSNPGRVLQIYIPSTVTTIDNSAFEECEGLTSIKIPTSVTNLGSDIFRRCINLSNVEIPTTISTLSNGLFSECTSLSNISIPNSITKIESYVFYGCTSLREIIIPVSVTQFGYRLFSGCSNLKLVHMKPTLPPVLQDLGGDYNAFYQLPENTIITVPVSSLAAYKSAEGWSKISKKIISE